MTRIQLGVSDWSAQGPRRRGPSRFIRKAMDGCGMNLAISAVSAEQCATRFKRGRCPGCRDRSGPRHRPSCPRQERAPSPEGVCSIASGSRAPARAAGDACVNSRRWPDWQTGSNPPSPDQVSGDGSMTSGVPKKSRTSGQAPGKLRGCLPGCKTDLAAQQVRRSRTVPIPPPTQNGWAKGWRGTCEPCRSADERRDPHPGRHRAG
jgi:hypothetical protein